MTRAELEDLVWELPSIKESGVDFEFIQDMTDAELRELLNPAKPKPVKIDKPEETAKGARIRFPAPRCVAFKYVERDGRLKRLETWEHQNAGGTWKTSIETPCGAQVQFEGRRVAASIVLHWLRTGEIVKRAPRGKAKPFKCVVRVNGKPVHIGYFSTIAERDAARDKARFNLSLGLDPVG